MPRTVPRLPLGRALLLLALCAAVTGCTALRKDRTEFENDTTPAAGGVVPIGNRYSVVVDDVKGTWNGIPYEATPDTRFRFSEMLRTSLMFEAIHQSEPPDATGFARVSIDASYESDPHEVANLFRALLVGTIGYRLEIEGNLVVTIRLPGAPDPFRYEVRTRATRVYYSSGRAGESTDVLLREVEAANQDEMRAHLRADLRLVQTTGAPASGSIPRDE